MRRRGAEHRGEGRSKVCEGLAASHRKVSGAGFPHDAWIVSSSMQRACAVTTGAAESVTARSARDDRMDSRNCVNRLTITQAGKSTARTNVCGTRVSGDPGAASFPGGPTAAKRRLTSISLGKTLPNVDRQRGTRGTPPATIWALERSRSPVRAACTPALAPRHLAVSAVIPESFFRPARILYRAFGRPPHAARVFHRRPFVRADVCSGRCRRSSRRSLVDGTGGFSSWLRVPRCRTDRRRRGARTTAVATSVSPRRRWS